MFYRHASKLVGSTFFAQIAPLLILPILTRNMSQEAFGVYSLFFTSLIMIGTIAALRYDYALNSVEKLKQVNSLVFICILLACVTSVALFFLIIVLVAIGYLSSIWILLPVSVFLLSLQQTFYQYANNKHNFSLMAKSKVVQAFSTAATQLLLVYFLGIESGAFWGLAIGYLAVVAYFLLDIKLVRLWTNRDRLRNTLKEFYSYPTMIFPGTLLNFISGNIPIYLIGFVFGANVAGNYGLANRAAGIPTSMLARSFGEVYRSKALQDLNELGTFRATFIRVNIVVFVLAILGFGILFFFTEEIYRIVFGEGWDNASLFTKLLLPMFFMQFITTPVSYSLMLVGWQSKEFKWQGLRLLLMTISMAVAFIFYDTVNAYVIAASLSMTLSFLVYFYLCVKSAFYERLYFENK